MERRKDGKLETDVRTERWGQSKQGTSIPHTPPHAYTTTLHPIPPLHRLALWAPIKLSLSLTLPFALSRGEIASPTGSLISPERTRAGCTRQDRNTRHRRERRTHSRGPGFMRACVRACVRACANQQQPQSNCACKSGAIVSGQIGIE